jgi:hypothetical protein
MNGKKFRDNRTGEVVKVISSFENIAILENKTKVDVRRLTDTSYFTEEIDPSSFFNNQGAYNNLAEKIKNIPTNDIVDDGPVNTNNVQSVNYADNSYTPLNDGSAIIMSNIDNEREELARKYGINLDNTQAVVKQNEAFAQILGEEGVDELPVVSQAPVYKDDQKVQRVEVKRDGEGEVLQRPLAKQEDPINIMFRNAKKVVEFDLDLKLINKIPRLDFIEMMEDSYERSIIDFLASEITNDLLKNPNNLKFQISEKIKEMVYNRKPVKKTVVKKPIAKKPIAKKPTTKLKEDLKTITETETKPVRKPRIKKETEQHD